MFMFQSTKTLHLLQIVTAGLVGSYTESMLYVPTTDQVVHFIQVASQVLIAVVTCIAAIRKAIQKPIIAQAQSKDNVPTI